MYCLCQSNIFEEQQEIVTYGQHIIGLQPLGFTKQPFVPQTQKTYRNWFATEVTEVTEITEVVRLLQKLQKLQKLKKLLDCV